MEIKTAICEGTYDFSIELDEYKTGGESEFKIKLGDSFLILNKEEWMGINDLVTNSMDFLVDNFDNV